ncbi:uncharacterized protein M6B38_322625 [Iris pallida]|uniref:Uncharacterized protein n=1 Tax=Iris pallida TaxID=29817 RepID=A0AAX6HB70_IRIPA|nr:uncharacterized protein M6B38_322625 [Iris pallida]
MVVISMMTTRLPFFSLSPIRHFSLTKTPYPLYYELIRHRPSHPPHPQTRIRRGGGDSQPDPLPPEPAGSDPPPLDRSKRKYYRKRSKRMFGGSGSDSDSASPGGDFVELKPEVVDFPRLHAREQELYFHDAFAFPWEKDKHYRMVYQLEKKYFPDHCLDKAFVPVEDEAAAVTGRKKNKKSEGLPKEEEEKKLVFFDEGEKKGDVTERR